MFLVVRYIVIVRVKNAGHQVGRFKGFFELFYFLQEAGSEATGFRFYCFDNSFPGIDERWVYASMMSILTGNMYNLRDSGRDIADIKIAPVVQGCELEYLFL